MHGVIGQRVEGALIPGEGGGIESTQPQYSRHQENGNEFPCS